MLEADLNLEPPERCAEAKCELPSIIKLLDVLDAVVQTQNTIFNIRVKKETAENLRASQEELLNEFIRKYGEIVCADCPFLSFTYL